MSWQNLCLIFFSSERRLGLLLPSRAALSLTYAAANPAQEVGEGSPVALGMNV